MTEVEKDTTISISLTDKKRLDSWKIHRREPYKEVITRILDDLDKMKQAGTRLQSQPPQSYSSYLKALIDSMTQENKE